MVALVVALLSKSRN